MWFSFSLPLALAALIVEALIGYPAPLYRAIGHPVTWMGRWLAWLEAALNRADAASATRRAAGVLALCLYLAPVALISWAATRLGVSAGPLGFALLGLLAARKASTTKRNAPPERQSRVAAQATNATGAR